MHTLSLIRFNLLVAIPPAPPPTSSLPSATSPPQYYDTSSMNVLSFGFLAAAIFISLFLVVAVFERLLHKTPEVVSASVPPVLVGETSGFAPRTLHMDTITGSVKEATIEVSVLMPGQVVPTFIARPAPIIRSVESHGGESQKSTEENSAKNDC